MTTTDYVELLYVHDHQRFLSLGSSVFTNGATLANVVAATYAAGGFTNTIIVVLTGQVRSTPFFLRYLHSFLESVDLRFPLCSKRSARKTRTR